MKQKAAPKPAPRADRTTVAVSRPFAKKLHELALEHGLSVADYCDRHLDPKVTDDWRAMLSRKLKGGSGKTDRE